MDSTRTIDELDSRSKLDPIARSAQESVAESSRVRIGVVLSGGAWCSIAGELAPAEIGRLQSEYAAERFAP